MKIVVDVYENKELTGTYIEDAKNVESLIKECEKTNKKYKPKRYERPSGREIWVMFKRFNVDYRMVFREA